MRYNSIPSVCVVPGVTRAEANKPVEAYGLRPGESRLKLTGHAAMVGRYEEIWWNLRGAAFAPTADGGMIPDLHQISLHFSTPNVKFRELGDKLEADFSDYRDALRARGMVRIDPVLKKFSISETGLLTDSQWEIPRHFAAVGEKMRDPEFLAEVVRINGGHIDETWINMLHDRMLHRFSLPMRNPGEVAKVQAAISNLEGSVLKWVEAFRKAAEILEKEAPVVVKEEAPSRPGNFEDLVKAEVELRFKAMQDEIRAKIEAELTAKAEAKAKAKAKAEKASTPLDPKPGEVEGSNNGTV